MKQPSSACNVRQRILFLSCHITAYACLAAMILRLMKRSGTLSGKAKRIRSRQVGWHTRRVQLQLMNYQGLLSRMMMRARVMIFGMLEFGAGTSSSTWACLSCKRAFWSALRSPRHSRYSTNRAMNVPIIITSK